MNSKNHPHRALALLGFSVALLIQGCAYNSEERARERETSDLRRANVEAHTTFRAQPKWRSLTFKDDAVLARKDQGALSLRTSIADQRTIVLVDDLIAMDFPVATGKRSHPTPTGEFTVINRSSDHRSNLYGKIVDAEGTVVVGDADSRKDEVPEGGRFIGSSMPYFLRLTNTGVGYHVGYIPGRPASHGCIRMPRAVARQVFDMAKVGTPVKIEQQFIPASVTAAE